MVQRELILNTAKAASVFLLYVHSSSAPSRQDLVEMSTGAEARRLPKPTSREMPEPRAWRPCSSIGATTSQGPRALEAFCEIPQSRTSYLYPS